MTKSIRVFLVLLISIHSCKKNNSQEVELTYINGNEEVSIEIENNQHFLIYDRPTKVDFVLTNIDPFSLVVSGPGIKILRTKNKSILQTEINAPLII